MKNISNFTANHSIIRTDKNGVSQTYSDCIAVEEPLEINLGLLENGKRVQRNLAITMRTPGNDFDLARGFLFTEALIHAEKDIIGMRYVGTPTESGNRVLVELRPDLKIDLDKLKRHSYTSSSCGVCGKSSLDMVQQHSCFLLRTAFPKIHFKTFFQLPDRLRDAQKAFADTGGIHAAGLFDKNGKLLELREDVGRHNALDKLIGVCLNKNMLPLTDKIVLLSGRLSFELVQKSMMAGIPILAAVGAPSSLAIQLAAESGMTLVGFLKKEKFNIYNGHSRISTK